MPKLNPTLLFGLFVIVVGYVSVQYRGASQLNSDESRQIVVLHNELQQAKDTIKQLQTAKIDNESTLRQQLAIANEEIAKLRNKQLEAEKVTGEIANDGDGSNSQLQNGTGLAQIGNSNRMASEHNRYSVLSETSVVLNRKNNKNLVHTDTLMRRSRPIIGNTARLWSLIEKLIQKQCTTLLFVGGSVTHATRNVEGVYRSAYHVEFVKYLNEQYPCRDGEHLLHIHGPGGTDAAYAVKNFPQIFRGTNNMIDFVSFEYAVNDASTPPIAGRSISESIQINNEVLIRKALAYRNADGSAPAIIWLETSFFLSNLSHRDFHTSQGAAHVFTAGLHFPILSYYDIPTVSPAQVIFPMVVKSLHISRKQNPFKLFFMDKCHPSYAGHRFISQSLANMIETEKAWMLSEHTSSELENDDTLQNPPKLPNPWWLSDAEVDLMMNATTTEFSFQTDIPKESSLLFNTGWSIFADSKQKFGLISNKSASHVAFKIEMVNFDPKTAVFAGGSDTDYKFRRKVLAQVQQAINTISIGFLRTYEGVSDLLFWTDDQPDGSKLCKEIVVEAPGSCYEVGCRCELLKQKQLYPKSKAFLQFLNIKKYCINEDDPAAQEPLPKVSGEPQLYDFGALSPPGIEIERLDPLMRVHTSVFASTDVKFSEIAIKAATDNKPIYLHLCSTRFGEFGESFMNVAKKPAPTEGDGKFKVLLLAGVNANIKLDKEGERELSRRL